MSSMNGKVYALIQPGAKSVMRSEMDYTTTQCHSSLWKEGCVSQPKVCENASIVRLIILCSLAKCQVM